MYPVAKSSFETDVDISAKKKPIIKKQLVAFKLGENEQLYQGNLEEESNVKWNQFELNKQKYNVTSTYNKNNYTTQLDPNMIPQEHKIKTEKIIKEIYSAPAESTNIHVLEDRGLVDANEDMDEEDKYSSVLRQNNNNK